MKIAIMQPYFFPYIGYWQLINAVDKFVIYDDVNYIKKGWINRNNLLLDGALKKINIQLSGASQNRLINEIEVSDCKKHRVKVLKTIERFYGKAPFFKTVFPLMESIISYKEKNLALYLEHSIRKVCEYLAINTEIITSSTIQKDSSLKGQNKVIQICKSLGAKDYYNPIGGLELYSYEEFEENGLHLSFIKASNVEYKQYGQPFVPNLSIIDLMMFNSVEEIKQMLVKYEIIN